MRTQRHALAVAALTAALTGLACSAARVAPSAPPPPPIPDRALGLSKTSVFEVPAPPAWKTEDSTPGEKPLPPRISSAVPPVIPHGIEDLAPIGRDQNACVDCHLSEGPKKAGEATPIPASHFFDLRNAPEKRGAKVAGARWVCTACHVPRSDAPALVGNGYRP
jgi:nitrate reductase (cytochrome), electron transfer subunit